jgi:hypothetical protein
MASGVKQDVGCLVKDCEIDLDVCVAQVSLYVTVLGSYDIVIGMDWLENHEAMLDCKNKRLYFTNDAGHKRTLVGKNRGVSLRFISYLQLKRSMQKDARYMLYYL